MTLTLDLDLDVMKMYRRTKNKVCRSRHSKVRTRTGQTDRQTHATGRITTPHSRAAINSNTFTRRIDIRIFFIDLELPSSTIRNADSRCCRRLRCGFQL